MGEWRSMDRHSTITPHKYLYTTLTSHTPHYTHITHSFWHSHLLISVSISEDALAYVLNLTRYIWTWSFYRHRTSSFTGGRAFGWVARAVDQLIKFCDSRVMGNPTHTNIYVPDVYMIEVLRKLNATKILYSTASHNLKQWKSATINKHVLIILIFCLFATRIFLLLSLHKTSCFSIYQKCGAHSSPEPGGRCYTESGQSRLLWIVEELWSHFRLSLAIETTLGS